MYYSININQIAISQHNKKYQTNLNLIDGAILQYLQKQATSTFARKNFITIEGEIYYRLCYDNIITQLPLIDIENKESIGRRIKKLKDLNIIKFYLDKNAGNKTYFTTTDLFETFFSYHSIQESTGIDSRVDRVSIQESGYIDNNIKDNNININSTTEPKIENQILKAFALSTIEASEKFKDCKNVIDALLQFESNSIGRLTQEQGVSEEELKLQAIEDINKGYFKETPLLRAKEISDYFIKELKEPEFINKLSKAFYELQLKNFQQKSQFLFIGNFSTQPSLLNATINKRINATKTTNEPSFIDLKAEIVNKYNSEINTIKKPSSNDLQVVQNELSKINEDIRCVDNMIKLPNVKNDLVKHNDYIKKKNDLLVDKDLTVKKITVEYKKQSDYEVLINNVDKNYIVNEKHRQIIDLLIRYLHANDCFLHKAGGSRDKTTLEVYNALEKNNCNIVSFLKTADSLFEKYLTDGKKININNLLEI